MDMNKHIVHNLEEKITDCWNVTSEIKLVYEEYMDSATPMSEDELMNILVGIEYLYERKFNRMNEAFEEICAHGGVWLTDEQVAEAKDSDTIEWSEGPVLNPIMTYEEEEVYE